MEKLFSSLVWLVLATLIYPAISGPERRTKYGCEGSSLELECEEGTVISLVRANYGRFSISICNGEGNTAWSVNCMEPRTLRVINTRCGSRQSCSVPVNSTIFGDPCPGTSKYVEVHYTCNLVPVVSSTPKPLPPWLLDLSATPSSDWKLTTSLPTVSTTISSSTTTATITSSASTYTITSSTTTSTTRTSLFSTKSETVTKSALSLSPTVSSDAEKFLQKDHDDSENVSSDSAEYVNHCHPTNARGMFWNWTHAEESAIQPCPAGTQGFARWKCILITDPSLPDSEGTPVWEFDTPDLSECQAHWITRLETRLRSGDSVIGIAADMMAVAETRSLYGGDLTMIAQLMRGLATRLRQEVGNIQGRVHQENLVNELMQNVQRTASGLLDNLQEAAWNDLRPSDRASVGTALLMGLEENAYLVADTVDDQKNLVDVTKNILSSIRVMEARDPGSQYFPSLDTLHMSDQVRVHVPEVTTREHSVNGAVRMIFFLYDHLDRVLPSSTNGVKFLNSKIVSARVSQQDLFPVSCNTGSCHVSEPITVTFTHLQTAGVSSPSCMWWDYVTRTWTEDNCHVASTNVSHTTCMCHQLGNIAVLMSEGDDGEAGVDLQPHQPQVVEDMNLNMASMVGVVVAVIAGVCLAVVGFIILRRLNLKTGLHKFITTGRLPCLHCRDRDRDEGKQGKGGLYPTINSSPTSTTLSSGTPTTSTTMSSNYFLNSECQLTPDPVILSPMSGSCGPTSTIYRATLANGQQVPVIPVSHIQVDQHSQYFRPVSPLGHIYMEIDPVYARLDPADTPQSDLQLSDVSDDDLRRSSDISRQSSNRYAEERPLIRSTLRKSAPHSGSRHGSPVVRTVSAGCGSSLRVQNNKIRPPMLLGGHQTMLGGHPGGLSRLDAPITIALSPGGEQFVSMNLDQAQQGLPMYHQHQHPPHRGYHHHTHGGPQ